MEALCPLRVVLYVVVVQNFPRDCNNNGHLKILRKVYAAKAFLINNLDSIRNRGQSSKSQE